MNEDERLIPVLWNAWEEEEDEVAIAALLDLTEARGADACLVRWSKILGNDRGLSKTADVSASLILSRSIDPQTVDVPPATILTPLGLRAKRPEIGHERDPILSAIKREPILSAINLGSVCVRGVEIVTVNYQWVAFADVAFLHPWSDA